MNPNKHITRIENKNTEGRSPVRGWEVRIYRRGKRFNKFFSDSAHGGKKKALEEACKVRGKMEKKLRPYTRKEIAEKVTSRNSSGYRGIRLRKTTIKKDGGKIYNYEHVEVTWSPTPRKVVKKTFSVAKLGLDQAWAAAINTRQKGVASLKN